MLIKSIVYIILSINFLSPSVYGADTKLPFTIELDEQQKLSAQYPEDVLLKDFLEEIGRLTDFSVEADAVPGWDEEYILPDLENSSLPKSLEILLRGWNYAVFTDEQSGRIKTVMIFGREEEYSDDARVAEIRATKPEELSYLDFQEMSVFDQASYILDHSTDATERANAILAVPRFEDREDVRDLLGNVLLSDSSETEKMAALEALVDTGIYDEAAIASVRDKALDNGNPEMQKMALEVLYRYDESDAGRAVLHKLAVQGGTLGKTAIRELKRMASEAEARASGADSVQRSTEEDVVDSQQIDAVNR